MVLITVIIIIDSITLIKLMLSLLRLLQLASANLPIGGYTYSQGLEWAVDIGWVTNAAKAQKWIQMQMETHLTYSDVPLLARFYYCCQQGNLERINYWHNFLLSTRETTELRNEEKQRGTALIQVLKTLCSNLDNQWANVISHNSLAGWAWAGIHWKIPLTLLQHGWLFNWLENSVVTAMKLVPLGQQSGQSLIFQLANNIPYLIKQANQLSDEQLGGSFPLLAIASSCHETQYSRLFRS